ncbi:hypothetical protein DNTS_030464 [Danionella cerebrum]|uniref:Uncharacterized protein n=1 Tax=Danionella cerebrum TaxID=2873325 RepID=A0A553MLY6_9TELE|nr:hypothetical protein DNTS_030464 [Danionella translucida]TRY54195.1 hypothetical protein DNTS_030464 [Danionella translucida]TRY54196.1 hypothetical protein DNTS_030464 [Danionella translucida]
MKTASVPGWKVGELPVASVKRMKVASGALQLRLEEICSYKCHKLYLLDGGSTEIKNLEHLRHGDEELQEQEEEQRVGVMSPAFIPAPSAENQALLLILTVSSCFDLKHNIKYDLKEMRL